MLMAKWQMDTNAAMRRTDSLSMRMRVGVLPRKMMAESTSVYAEGALDLYLRKTTNMEVEV